MSKIVFSMYVAEPRSQNTSAIKAFEKVCKEQLELDTYQINIVDITHQAPLAEKNKILAIPTIIREKPLPERRIIGDIRHAEKAISALEFLMDEIEIKNNYERK